MQKIKKILVLLLILFCIPIITLAQEIDDEYEELDYVWLEEEIENAKKEVEPQIDSRCALVFDRGSKTVIYGKAESKKVPMASTTKIMTAIVMLENIGDLNERIEVCKEAASIGGSRLGLKVGDKITYNDLLYGLMLCSGNDAAVQIAVSIGGSIERFAELMNEKTKELGLENTNFIVPHGLDNENHYTTALELAIITDYALNIKEFSKVVSTKTYTVIINNYPKNIRNTNELLGYLDGVNGVKTGFTNGAGRCLVTSVSRNSFNIITIVLGADTKKIRTKDSIKLIEFTYNNYELVDMEDMVNNAFKEWKNVNEKRIKVYKGEDRHIKVSLGVQKYKKYPIKKSEKNNIYININSIFQLEAPVEKNRKIGDVKVVLNNWNIMNIDILNNKIVSRKTCLDYINELFQMYKIKVFKSGIKIVSSQKKHPLQDVLFLEATPGFEPGNQSFADSCLTTWLCRHNMKFLLMNNLLLPATRFARCILML